MAPHSSTLAWKIPWTEEPGRLQSMGSRRIGHDWATSLSPFTFMHWRRKWQPTQCSCLENPRDGGAWWAAVYGVAQRTRLKWLSSSSQRTPMELKYLPSLRERKKRPGVLCCFFSSLVSVNPSAAKQEELFLLSLTLATLHCCRSGSHTLQRIWDRDFSYFTKCERFTIRLLLPPA